jgi:DNA-binding transcriptional regulator YiaG
VRRSCEGRLFFSMDNVQHLWTLCNPLRYNFCMTNEELLAWRNGRGLTRQQLADSLGVSSWTIVKWERGERKIPAYLWRALEHLDCTTRRPPPSEEG